MARRSIEEIKRMHGMSVPDIQGTLRNAGFWVRVLASIFDSVFILAIYISLIYIIGLDWKDKNDLAYFDNLIPLVTIFYYISFPSIFSATPGKMILGLKVVVAGSEDALSFGRVILRLLGYVISGIPLNLGFIWIAIDKDKRGFHDYIAGTEVIYMNR
jgi:uncharacterized RDD family membrane protein YckC